MPNSHKKSWTDSISHPFYYWRGSKLLNFSDQKGTDSLRMIWSLVNWIVDYINYKYLYIFVFSGGLVKIDKLFIWSSCMCIHFSYLVLASPWSSVSWRKKMPKLFTCLHCLPTIHIHSSLTNNLCKKKSLLHWQKNRTYLNTGQLQTFIWLSNH